MHLYKRRYLLLFPLLKKVLLAKGYPQTTKRKITGYGSALPKKPQSCIKNLKMIDQVSSVWAVVLVKGSPDCHT